LSALARGLSRPSRPPEAPRRARARGVVVRSRRNRVSKMLHVSGTELEHREVTMIKLVQQRNLLCGAALAASVIGFGAGVSMLQMAATAQDTMVEAPIFEVDPLWPKPLPNEALLGMTIGVSVDEQDNVWITHRGSATLNNNEKGAELNPPVAICCRGAPAVIAFNPDGDVIHSWGGPGQGYEWPESMHGIHIDHKGN